MNDPTVGHPRARPEDSIANVRAQPALEVRTARHYWKRVVLLYLFLGPFAALGIAQAVFALRRQSTQWEGPMMLLGVVLVMMLVPGALVVARRRWVARFDEHGVVLRNGRRFTWENFEKVEERFYRHGRTVGGHALLNNYDLIFRDGTAAVYHLMAENEAEVLAALRALQCGDNPFRPRTPGGPAPL